MDGEDEEGDGAVAFGGEGSGSSDESDEPTGKTTKTKEEEVTDWNKALEEL